MIMQQVTIGQLAEEYAPTIGSHVYIGAGAKVLGRIVIGDRARIGANAVVLADVPADGTAVGIPARIA
jgi:serine O-acetyltransferase